MVFSLTFSPHSVETNDKRNNSIPRGLCNAHCSDPSNIPLLFQLDLISCPGSSFHEEWLPRSKVSAHLSLFALDKGNRLRIPCKLFSITHLLTRLTSTLIIQFGTRSNPPKISKRSPVP
eukprot:scaffold13570_cov201-Alexandrium_tamarense.AAC.2